ncbi:MAG: substrate-binding domain-containing protein, partial [Cyanobacteria bacterium P01_H01_bin.130]
MLALLASIGFLGIGMWWLINRLELLGPANDSVAVSSDGADGAQPPAVAPAPNGAPDSAGLASLPSAPVPNAAPAPAAPAAAPATFTLPQSIPQGTTIRIGGSTSMVQISQSLKLAMEGRYPGVVIAADAQGSGAGLAAIVQGTLDVSGVSRPLTPEESQSGLVAVPVARDAIAVVVGRDNPFTGSLSPEQVAQIFQG